MMEWIYSYSNHALYCSLYTGVVAYALKSSKRISASTTATTTSSNLSHVIIGGVAAFSLYMELDYIFKRIGLPPGDSGYPIFGHSIQWVLNPGEFLTKRWKKYGRPFTANLFARPSIVLGICSDEDVRWINMQERKGNLVPMPPGFVKDLVGKDIIIFVSSKKHRRLRHIFEPSFSPSAIKSYVETIDNVAMAELEKWCGKDSFCTSTEWSFLAMRLFFVCAFGDVDESMLAELNRLFTIWINGIMGIPIAIPGTAYYKGLAAGKDLVKLVQQMVDKFKSENPPGSNGAENSMMGRLCYGVDEDGKTLTDEQLTTNIRLIMFAGHDTTKGSFSGFMHYLYENPTIRHSLIEEVKGFSEPLNTDELKAAPMLNAVMAETWRLIPPVDSHSVVAVTDLEYKGYKIRKGVSVVSDISCTSLTDEGLYPDPLEFRVERWLPNDHPLHDPKYYLKDVDYNVMSPKFRAFNSGPHMCLGAHFARLEARVVMTRLLQNYDFVVRNSKVVHAPVHQYTNEFKLSKRQ